MNDFVKKAEETGAEKYKSGINCAESIVVTFDELCHLGIGENVKLSSGFGGGIGQAADLCGVMSGAVMVLGALAGRPNPPEGEREPIYKLSKGFYDKFKAEQGATDCLTLRKYPSGTREQRINCLKLVAAGAKSLAEYLIEKGLVKQ